MLGEKEWGSLVGVGHFCEGMRRLGSHLIYSGRDRLGWAQVCGYIMLRVPESPEFVRLKREGKNVRLPLVKVRIGICVGGGKGLKNSDTLGKHPPMPVKPLPGAYSRQLCCVFVVIDWRSHERWPCVDNDDWA